MNKKPPHKIQYIETHHKCKCERCGQVFYVVIGDIDRDPCVPPYQIRAQCPACDLYKRIHSKYAQAKCLYVNKCSDLHFEAIIRNGCTCGQATTESLLHEVQMTNNHLNTLKYAVQSTISSWENHWDRAVLVKPMKNLQRIIKEIDLPTD